MGQNAYRKQENRGTEDTDVKKKPGRPGKTKQKTERRAGNTDYRTYRLSPGEMARTTAEGLGAGLLIVWLCYRSLYALPVLAPVLILYTWIRKRSL